MTQVQFYILSDEKPKAAFSRAIEFIDQAYQRKQNVFIHTCRQSDAEYMDELLWVRDADSFLPHLLVDEAVGVMPPIQIGYGQEPKIKPDVLVNLADEIPRFHGQFEHLIEFAHGEESTRQKARERFKYYRDRGYPLRHQNLD